MKKNELRVELIYFMIKNNLKKKDCIKMSGVSYHILTRLIKEGKQPDVVNETRLRQMLDGE